MNSNIALLLKSKRRERNLSVKEVRENLRNRGIDVSDKTIYGWESGHRQPDADTFVALCRIYQIESFSEVKESNGNELCCEERDLIKKYRLLDPYGKEAVDGVLDVEYRRCRQNQAARDAALFRGGREETEAAEIFPELKMPTLVSKSGLEAEKKQLMEALDKFSPVQLQMYFDQMRKLSGLQIEASPSFVPPEDAQKVLGPDSSAPPL